MTLVERTGEQLARRIDRRQFLSRTAAAIFGTAAAFAYQGIRAPRALGDGPCPWAGNPYGCHCQPLGGTYCSSHSSSYCSGASCAGGCTVNKSIWPSTGCWCSKNCCYNCGFVSAYCGYYTCCDCTCPFGGCTCKTFTYTCRCAAAADCVICC
jgi:hypothetical protein